MFITVPEAGTGMRYWHFYILLFGVMWLLIMRRHFSQAARTPSCRLHEPLSQNPKLNHPSDYMNREEHIH